MPIRTINDILAIERVPLESRALPPTIYEMLAGSVAEHADRVAIRFLTSADTAATHCEISYQEFFATVNRCARMFQSLGAGPCDSVSWVLPNVPQLLTAQCAAEAVARANPVNPALGIDHLVAILRAAAAKVLLAPSPEIDPAGWSRSQEIATRVPSIAALLAVHFPREKCSSLKANELNPHAIRVHCFNTLLKEFSPDRLPEAQLSGAGDLVAYFHTGGTTGVPKLAPWTNRMQVVNAWQMRQALELMPGETVLCGLPMFHANGIMVTGLVPLSVGATVLIATPNGFRDQQVIQKFWQLVDTHQVNFFSAVPTIYAALLNIPIGNARVDSLRFGICGAAPMPVDLFRRFEKKSAVRIREGYGLTEATCGCTINPEGDPKIGSVGLRIPYLEVEVAQTDSTGQVIRKCESYEVGNLLIRGPSVFPGYQDPAANRGLFTHDGWFNTGDLARMDADGYVWLTGRSKDLIIRGGHNIDPAIIEDCLTQHDVVELAAAVSQPDPHSGEVPAAYVTLRPGKKATKCELQTWAREHIAERAAVPVRVEILARMPVTAVGKIFKPDLRVMAAEHAVREALLKNGINAVVHGRMDESWGLVIRVKSGDPAVMEVLGNFSFKLEIH